MPLSGLWTPRSAQDPKPKVWLCTSCLSEFPLNQRPQFERHVVKCSEANDDMAQEVVKRRESSVFTSITDKERFAHLRKYGPKNALRRRRMK